MCHTDLAFCIPKALLKYLNLVRHSTELRGRQASVTAALQTAPGRLKQLSLTLQQVNGRAGITAQEVPGSFYTGLWRKVISQNSAGGLLLIIGQQRALDVLIGDCVPLLVIHNLATLQNGLHHIFLQQYHFHS